MASKHLRRGRVVADRFPSKALRGNPLHDPYDREFLIYLPPSYDKDSNTRYPVVLCLTGFSGSARSWFNFQPWIPSIDERMDQLIHAGVQEMILVFPDCFTRYGGSQFLDSPAVGNYRTYLVDELLPYVEGHYRIRSDRRFRGVMGKSSGGYGAICMAMDHPNIFSAAASHSGDMYFEYCYFTDFPIAYRRLERYRGLKSFLHQFQRAPKADKEDFSLINTVAMAACYSPNPKRKPHLFDLPFSETTGELDAQVWNQWKQKDPVVMLESQASNLKKIGLLFLDCGKRDEFNLLPACRIFTRRLRERKIAHVYEEFDGGHFNVQYRYDISLRKLGEYFSAK